MPDARSFLSVLRRAFRRAVPRRLDPVMDGAIRRDVHDERCARTYLEIVVPDAGGDPFVLGRYDEALRWRHVLESVAESHGRVLDVGAGNGAVELAFAAAGRTIVGVDAIWNETVRHLHRAAGLPLRRVIAAADALPFRERAFDQIVCLETLEHLSRASDAGREMLRVLAAGGAILVTTPPRFRYLVAADPHFGIRGLLLLPAVWQGRVAARRGFGGPHHYVDRLYWTVGQIGGLFRDASVERVFSRSRLPRRLFWDAIVFRKGGRAE
jgi:SAM-dependent methyltransferase